MKRQGLRYLIVGGANTLGSYLLYCLLLLWIGPQPAWLTSYAISMLAGYVAHSRLVFDAQLGARPALGYIGLQFLMYFLSSGVLAVGLHYRLDPRIAAAVTIAITVPISFLLSRWLLAARASSRTASTEADKTNLEMK